MAAIKKELTHTLNGYGLVQSRLNFTLEGINRYVIAVIWKDKNCPLINFIVDTSEQRDQVIKELVNDIDKAIYKELECNSVWNLKSFSFVEWFNDKGFKIPCRKRK